MLKDLGDSSSPEKIKVVLKTFLTLASENKDMVTEMLSCGIVQTLVGLFGSSKGKIFKRQIACILVLLSFEGDGNDEDSLAEITMAALANIFSNSELSVFLQCVSGIQSIAMLPSKSITSTSSSSTSLPAFETSPTHLLSVFSSCMILEKTTFLLLSPSLRDLAKVEVLDTLLQLVNAGVMNEAAEFVEWRQTQVHELEQDQGRSGGQCEGGGGGRKCDVVSPTVRFTKAFAEFTEVVRGISLTKKRQALGGVAEMAYRAIQEKTFFPTSACISVTKNEAENPSSLALKFLTNSVATNATVSGSKLVWNSGGVSSFFVEPEIAKDIYKIVIETNGIGQLLFGLATKNLLRTLANSYFHSQVSGTCFIAYNCMYCANSTVVNHSFFPFNNKVTLALELDANKHILYFFVNGSQILHCIINVPPSVYFGMCNNYAEGLSVELKSLAKLTTPSINSSLVCTQHNWK